MGGASSRRRRTGSRRLLRSAPAGVVACLLAGLVVAVPPQSAGASAGAPAAVVRVDQVGYPTDGVKVAEVMATAPSTGLGWRVVASDGTTALSGTVGRTTSWNRTYRFVAPVSFTALTTPGTYTLQVATTPVVSSPVFTVAPPTSLWTGALANALAFYQTEQDGPDYVPSALRTAPAHLNDAAAMTYATPRVNGAGDFKGDLSPLGATIDASGGWWDAGDYLKFVETTSYVVAVLGAGAVEHPRVMGAPSTSSDFLGEEQVGIDWLEKMWDDATKTLYYQVGIGEGNATTVGDHDLWRLPQADDTYGGNNPADRYIRHRPVFEAGPPGSPVSPNLAGRLAADFGLCARLFAVTEPGYAATCLRDGEDVFALADTHPTGHLLTTIPYDFYPETQWRDDLELGATELAAALGPTTPAGADYLATAARWAAADEASKNQDSLNLYDVSGLADYELALELRQTGAGGLAVTVSDLEAHLASQLAGAEQVGRKDPFGAGYPWKASDTVAHDAGLSVTASELDALTGTDTYGAQAQRWLDDILGADPWGESFVIGDGTDFPTCPQHQVANLVGSLDGSPPVLAGAAVEGPTHRASRGLVAGMRACPASGVDTFAPFNGKGAVFRDDVQSYSTDEPAIDLTAPVPLAMAWLADPTG